MCSMIPFYCSYFLFLCGHFCPPFEYVFTYMYFQRGKIQGVLEFFFRKCQVSRSIYLVTPFTRTSIIYVLSNISSSLKDHIPFFHCRAAFAEVSLIPYAVSSPTEACCCRFGSSARFIALSIGGHGALSSPLSLFGPVSL